MVEQYLNRCRISYPLPTVLIKHTSACFRTASKNQKMDSSTTVNHEYL